MAERISDAEHAVMEVLWDEAPLDAQSIFDRLASTQSWTLATVKTLLSRLVAKDALATEAEGRKFLYRPVIARTDYVSGESRRLVDRLFGGRVDHTRAEAALARHLDGAGIDHVKELTHEDRLRIFHLGYFTWVEQQGVSLAEFDARKSQGWWSELPRHVPAWDESIARWSTGRNASAPTSSWWARTSDTASSEDRKSVV